MDNKKIFNKSKLALAIVLSVGLAACGGDDGSTATSNDVATATADATQPATNPVHMPTGSIQGVVLDSNANPVVGATVTTAGVSVVTDSSGSYLFNDIQVTNVAGADAGTAHAAFVIVIQAPTGYASTATVSVTPNAQIDAANSTTVNVGLTTFVDGFLAQATTAVMPKMESSIEGYLRNSLTGEPIANATLALDFTGIAGTLNTPNGNVSLSGNTVTVTTGDDGHFMFTGVSNDSTFNLSVSGYTFVLPAAGQTVVGLGVTTAEQVEQWIGTLTAVANTSTDSLAPFITSVNSSIGAATDAYNMLEPGFDGTTGIVFNMSEAVTQTIEATNVSVWSETLGAYKAVASVTQTATTLTVTLTDAIASGEQIQVLFQMNELRDGAGNLFTITELPTNLVYTAANATQTTYAQVRLQGHFVADTTAAITLAQTWSETTTDAYEDSDGTVQAGVNRLNSDATNSSARLENRLDAEDDGLLNTSGAAVVGTTATIAIDQTAGVSYILTMPAGAGVNDVKNGATAAVVAIATYGTGITNTSLILENVAVGEKVSVTPLDDFGNPGTTQTITLTDNVPATTALQESYGLGQTAALIFGGGVTTVIDGGENSVSGTTGSAGDPLIYVTPRLLAGSDASWNANILAGNQVFTGLGGLPTTTQLAGGIAPVAITPEAYTASQFAAFVAAPVSATFGVSFTEAVTVTGAPAWAGTATLTNWLSATNPASSEDTVLIANNSNFVGLMVTTNDVLTLGNVDANNATANAVNFTDTVADVATNNSGVNSNARVAFADALPPFVVSAVLTVPTFTVVFNESINDLDWEAEVLAMTLQDDAVAPTALSAAAIGFVAADLSISLDGKTVTFDNTGLASTTEFTNLINLFSNGAVEAVPTISQADDSYDFAENGIVRGHARLDFNGVSDAVADNNNGAGIRTNSWSAYVNDIYDFNGVAAAGATNMNVAPLFMAWSEIPEFDATLNFVQMNPLPAPVNQEFTLTLTTGTGLAFDLDASFVQGGNLTNVLNATVATGPLVLTGTQVDELFDFNVIGAGTAANVDVANSSGLITQGGTAISITIRFDGTLLTNDQILFQAGVLTQPNTVTDTLGRDDAVQAVVVP